jgi:hypothetical protein
MATLQQAEKVFKNLEHQLLKNPLISGIEIAALRRGDTFTDDLCVRILVNSQKATHETLNVPTEMDGVGIEVRYGVITLQ